jgi:hypothetical protein
MATLVGGAHVPRAVLATAAEFGDVPRSMAEYIWNSLEYKRDRSASAIVTFRFGEGDHGRWFEVEDFANGAGMDTADLQRYFTMNAPNENRLRGEAGRGRNGTGKAAAFGVGSVLEVYTVKDGLANTVRLDKGDLIALESTYPCETLPLRHVVVDQPVDPNGPRYGTRIRVSGIRQQFEPDAVVRNLTRLFMRVLEHNEVRWERRPGKFLRVLREPPVTIMNQTYECPESRATLVGRPTLRLAATDYDLPKYEGGVVFTSVGGAVLETGYMNVSRRRTPVDKRILGDIDVPLLDQPDSLGRPASTQARRLQMNRESERVEALLPWVDQCLDDFKQAVEQKLSSTIDERDRGVLDAISGTLEHVLNRHYEQFMREYATRMRLPKVDPLAPFPGEGSASDGGPTDGGEGEQVYVKDPSGEARAVPSAEGEVQLAGQGKNAGEGGSAAGTGASESARLDPSGDSASPKRRGPKKGRGGRSLRVVYLGLGSTSPRAYFDGEGTFTVNMDHPDFEDLEKSDPEFMRRSAEGCAVTYAEAILEMRINDGDPTVSQPKEALMAYLDEHDKILRPLIEACPSF